MKNQKTQMPFCLQVSSECICGCKEYNQSDFCSDYLVTSMCRVKDGEALHSQQKTRPGVDCGSGHEILIAKFRLKLKEVGKTTRLFRYDLFHVPFHYTVEVTKRFKGLDLIDGVPEELWMKVCDIVHEAKNKKKKYKTAKWLSEETLQIAVKEEKQKAKEKRKD